MVEIKKLNKHFGRLHVLKDVDLEFSKGQSIALIGPNGCGKTTLIKSILGMVLPESGSIFFEGKSIALSQHYRSEIGYMPQIGRYPENMRVGQVIDTLVELRNHTRDLDTDLHQAYKIREIANKRMNTLSGGTRQKVSATLAFMFDPKVLILDEPTAGLDPLASEILKEKILLERKKDKLMLITSHLLSELDEIISEVVFMQEGSVKFHQSTERIKEATSEKSLAKAISTLLKNEQNHQIYSH
jgi:Cu-processing system ATP-binding protein